MDNKKMLISGPCSAETEKQLVDTALQLKETGLVDYLRAGIWKPRTNPGGYEGAGIKGLSWLLNAKKETGLKTATEVATGKHVEDSLNFEVDLLWIGARTSVNPFSVQQVADALKGTNAMVYIKNPVNPDIKLWIGALERIQKAGIMNVGLIHRGFSSYGNTEFRNAPLWQIPIEMKRLFPEIPMICDPSHITGDRTRIFEISQKSLDLDYDGLIIESHISPDDAWTDKAQQITPKQLQTGYENLVLKSKSTDILDFQLQLDELRQQINFHDDELLSLIRSRMNIAEKIGELKKNNQVTVLQNNRWNEILLKSIDKGTKLNLSEEFVRSVMELLHVESIRLQNEIKEVSV
ncbi:MAG: chorismate mutase [Crocinitomicaceae bacterium]|jgi:chorismate mutase